MRVWPVVCLLGGCLDIPEFVEPDHGAMVAPVEVVGMQDTIVQIVQPDYELNFPMFDIRPRMPDALTIDGIRMLGTDNDCNEFDLVGNTIYPIGRISGGMNAMGATTSFQVNARGPAVAQIIVAWSGTYTCDGAIRMATGSTMFTAYPRNRLIRHDEITPTQDNISMTTTCGCPGDGDYYLTSYFAFFEPSIDRVTFRQGDGDFVDDTTPLLGEDLTADWGCIEGGSNRLAVVWDTPLEAGERTRITQRTSTNIIFSHDLRFEVTMGVDAETLTSTTTLFPAVQATCNLSAIAPLAETIHAAPTIDIIPDGEQSIAIALDKANGVYAVEVEQVDPPASSYEASSEETVAGGFAISVVMPDGAAPTVRIGSVVGADGYEYIAQPAVPIGGGAFRHLVWFRDDLLPDATIRISQ
jgi:hypothetical protein